MGVGMAAAEDGAAAGAEKVVAPVDCVGVTRLERSIGLGTGVALIMGVIIGSGIFVSPTYVLQGAGSVGSALLVWFCSGVFCHIGALCLTELDARVNRPGGMYGYILAVFGDFAGFLYLWLALAILAPAGNAIIALSCGNYLLQAFYSCGAPASAITITAILVTGMLTYINCASSRWAARLQDVCTVIKILALLLLILTGLAVLSRGELENLERPFADSSTSPGQISFALYSGLFAYSGWYSINFLTEEIKDPYRTLPMAIWLSLPLTTIIYVLTNVAYFVVLGPAGVLESDAVAMTLAERLYGPMSWIMPMLVGASCLCSLNGLLMSVSRLFFSGAQNGHLPQILALVSMKTLTPVPAILFESIVSMAMCLAKDISFLLNCAMFVESVSFLVCTCALFYLRWRAEKEPAVKVNLVLHILFFFVSLYLVVVPLFTAPRDVAITLLFAAAAIPAYIVGVMWKHKPAVYQRLMGHIYCHIQMCMMGAPSEEETAKTE